MTIRTHNRLHGRLTVFVGLLLALALEFDRFAAGEDGIEDADLLRVDHLGNVTGHSLAAAFHLIAIGAAVVEIDRRGAPVLKRGITPAFLLGHKEIDEFLRVGGQHHTIPLESCE